MGKDVKEFLDDNGRLDDVAFDSYADSEGLAPSESAELLAEIEEVEGEEVQEREVSVPRGFEDWYKTIKEIPLLTPEQERELGSIIKYSEDQDKVKEARNELVRHNLRFVVSVASKYVHWASPSHGFEDMVQDGSIGLTRAAEKFDVDKGFRFTTYAKDWIRASVQRGIQANGYKFAVSSAMAEKHVKLVRISNELFNELKRNPSIEEIADRYNQIYSKGRPVTADVVSEIFTLMSDKHDSLDREIGDEGDTTLGDFIENQDPAFNPEEVASKHDIEAVLHEIIRTELNEREQRVIDARFGLTTEVKQNLEALGERMGVSRQRIKQIEESAIRKIAKALNERGIDRNAVLR